MPSSTYLKKKNEFGKNRDKTKLKDVWIMMSISNRISEEISLAKRYFPYNSQFSN